MDFLQNNQSSHCDVFSNKNFSRSVICKAKVVLFLGTPILLILGYPSVTHAQISSNALGNFGVQTPAERFFEAGRESFEQEIQQLQKDSEPSAELLDVSRAVQIRQDLLRLETPQLPAEGTPSSQIRQDSATALSHKKQFSDHLQSSQLRSP